MSLPLAVILLHFVGDWLAQSDWMALNKSKNNHILTIHVFVVSLFISLYSWKLGLATFFLHWGIDWVTSRLTSKLWFIELTPIVGLHRTSGEGYYSIKPGYRHWFFVTIGFDQVLHYLSYILVLRMIS